MIEIVAILTTLFFPNSLRIFTGVELPVTLQLHSMREMVKGKKNISSGTQFQSADI